MRLIRRPLLIIFLEICVAAGLPPSSAAPHKTSYSNALRHETSPYLRQHAHNPVNWYPWGPEALQKARRENKPILLSIGYNACHWCHVMERESFMDLGTAKLMNDNFVNIKVDREERPDLDAVYIRAVEEMTGQAGWPLTVFLTPDLQPFYGGTYFPKGDGYDRPSFKRVLKGINHAWRQDGPQIRVAAEKIKQRLLTGQTPIKEALTLNRNLLEQATVTLLQAADAEYGGLLNPDSKRKYPQPCTLELALQGSLPNSGRQASTRNACRSYLTNTLNQMSYGSIHDQLGGGFARYTMDRRWLVPHFEKMLYDNALLAKVYLQAAQAYKNPYWQKIGTSTLDFALRELKTPQGAFGSSLDADSQGQEGKYYLFTAQEIISILGKTEGAWFNEIYGITAAGDTRSGQNILHLTASPEQLAKRCALPEAEFQRRLERLKSAVLAARSKRVRPAFDHKILCNWNALITSSLVEGFKVSGNRRYLQAACQTQNFLLSNLYSPGRLHHSWAAGKAGADGFLDDYAFEIQALLDLAAVDGNPRWLQTAQLLSENMLNIFYDQKQQTFVFTPSTVLLPLTDQLDSPTPSGSSQAVLALLRLQRITGKSSYQQIARQVFERNLPAAIKYPSSYACFLSAFDFYLSPSIELVLSINSRKSDWRQLQELINGVYLPHATVVLYDPQTAGPLRSTPLLAERNLINSMPAVYICRNYTCDKPITSPVILKDKLLALSRLSP